MPPPSRLLFLLVVVAALLSVSVILRTLDIDMVPSFDPSHPDAPSDDLPESSPRDEQVDDDEIISLGKVTDSDTTPMTQAMRDVFLGEHSPSLPRNMNRKYFLYSPSGGFNNQRVEMEFAMIIGKILNRTVLIPCAGKHTQFWTKYEALTDQHIVPMDVIFDFERLSEFHPAIAIGRIPIKDYVDLIQKELGKNAVVTVFHAESKYWKAVDVNQFIHVKSRVLFFRGGEMYHNWHFSSALTNGVKEKIRFTSELREFSLRLVRKSFQGPFNALHVRMGDYSERTPSATQFKWRMERLGFKTDWPLFIATEPSSPKNYFKDICAQYKCLFSQDLDQASLAEFKSLFPEGQIRPDMTGIVEQLVCVAAKTFLGTDFSTFSWKIREMRKSRRFSFPEIVQPQQQQLPSRATAATTAEASRVAKEQDKEKEDQS